MPVEKPYVMPRPLPVVVWSQGPGTGTCYAIVTKYGASAVSLIVFPEASRIGIPKQAVRHISDPWNKQYGFNPDSGVWDYTSDQKALKSLIDVVSGLLPNDLPEDVMKLYNQIG